MLSDQQSLSAGPPSQSQPTPHPTSCLMFSHVWHGLQGGGPLWLSRSLTLWNSATKHTHQTKPPNPACANWVTGCSGVVRRRSSRGSRCGVSASRPPPRAPPAVDLPEAAAAPASADAVPKRGRRMSPSPTPAPWGSWLGQDDDWKLPCNNASLWLAGTGDLRAEFLNKYS